MDKDPDFRNEFPIELDIPKSDFFLLKDWLYSLVYGEAGLLGVEGFLGMGMDLESGRSEGLGRIRIFLRPAEPGPGLGPPTDPGVLMFLPVVVDPGPLELELGPLGPFPVPAAPVLAYHSSSGELKFEYPLYELGTDPGL